jgi:toxin ParE1/3/4
MHGAQALITLDQQEYVMDTPNLEPGLGRTRDELLAGLRSLPFERYMIFYVALEDGIDVVRVLHSERDVDAQFHPRA